MGALRGGDARGEVFFGSEDGDEEALRASSGLVQQDVRVYLVCVFDGYSDIRSLALHRIASVKVMAFPVKLPTGFKLAEYVKKAQAFNYDKGRWVEFSFRFTNPVTKLNLEETPFRGKGQTITKLPNGGGS